MKITCEARSDVGRKRKGNEDALFLNPEQKLYVVADGMGGHAAGEVASRVAVDAINEFVTLTGGNEEITWPFGLDDTISYDGNRLKTAIRHANRQGPRGHPGERGVRGHGHHRGRGAGGRRHRQPRPRGRQPHLPAGATARSRSSPATTPGSTSRSRPASSPPSRRAATRCATWSPAPSAAGPTCRSTSSRAEMEPGRRSCCSARTGSPR